MSLELTGRLLKKYDAVDVSPKFKKREFVVELSEEINGNTYINYAAMQLVNNKCSAIDQFSEGDMVKVSFNIRGSKWIKDGKERYFSNLDAWRVEPAGGNQSSGGSGDNRNSQAQYGGGSRQGDNGATASAAFSSHSSDQSDDLPF
jgi:Domain of unknown function (DUF3127)